MSMLKVIEVLAESDAGKRVSMRLWAQEPGGKLKAPTTREYETVG